MMTQCNNGIELNVTYKNETGYPGVKSRSYTKEHCLNDDHHMNKQQRFAQRNEE